MNIHKDLSAELKRYLIITLYNTNDVITLYISENSKSDALSAFISNYHAAMYHH